MFLHRFTMAPQSTPALMVGGLLRSNYMVDSQRLPQSFPSVLIPGLSLIFNVQMIRNFAEFCTALPCTLLSSSALPLPPTLSRSLREPLVEPCWDLGWGKGENYLIFDCIRSTNILCFPSRFKSPPRFPAN